jgi:uncharacterized protein HemY
VSDDAAASLARGQEHLADGDWSSAKHSFEASLTREETAGALFGLARALWWLGDTEAAVRLHEGAYAAFRASGDHAHAALAGVNL